MIFLFFYKQYGSCSIIINNARKRGIIPFFPCVINKITLGVPASLLGGCPFSSSAVTFGILVLLKKKIWSQYNPGSNVALNVTAFPEVKVVCQLSSLPSSTRRDPSSQGLRVCPSKSVSHINVIGTDATTAQWHMHVVSP